MSNMSYCRFENTANDLDDCHDELLMNEDWAKNLSPRELEKAKWLINMCRDIAENWEALFQDIKEAEQERENA